MAKRYHGMKNAAGANANSGAGYGSDMLKNAPGETANMPQHYMNKMYPSVNYISGTFDDTIRGIDEQMRADTNAPAIKRKASVKRY